jgi:hypothetical protein
MYSVTLIGHSSFDTFTEHNCSRTIALWSMKKSVPMEVLADRKASAVACEML